VLIRDESAFISIMPPSGCGYKGLTLALTLHFLKPAFPASKEGVIRAVGLFWRLRPRFLPNVDPANWSWARLWGWLPLSRRWEWLVGSPGPLAFWLYGSAEGTL